MTEREELEALRRLAELERKAAGGAVAAPPVRRDDPYTVWDKLKDSSLGGVVRGMRDPIDAGAQFLVRGANAVGLAPDSEVARVEGINRNAEQDYTQNWRRGKDIGFDGGRLVGNVLATAPLIPSGVGAAPTLGRLAASGAKAGAVGGALQPVLNTENGFWGQKGAQTALAATTGAVLTPVAAKALGGLGNIVSWIADRVRGKWAPKTNDEAWRVTVEALKANGIDPAQIDTAVRNQLIAEVKTALTQTGGVEPSRVARLADFKAAGVQPTRAMITRDPVQWTQEANLAGIKGVGDDLQHLRSRATNRIVEMVDEQAPKGLAGDDYTLGTIAAKGVQGVEKAKKGAVDALYTTFREVAPSVLGNHTRFVNNLTNKLDDAMVGGQLPGDFITRINQIAAGKFPLNASTMYQMQKAASAQSKGNPALGIFKSAIDDEMAAMADELGGSVGFSKDVLLAARKAARERFSLQDAVPAFKQAAEGALEPEQFLKRHILSASVGEVKQLWNAVKEPEARAAMAAQLVGYLKKAAIGTAQQDNPQVAQAMFNKAIVAPGMAQKLEIMIGAKGLEEIKRAGRIAEMVIRAPSGDKSNSSNTSQAVINQVSRLMGNTAGIPGLGPLITQPLQLQMQKVQAAQASNLGGLFGRPTPGVIDERRARLMAGLLAGPAGLLASGEFSR